MERELKVLENREKALKKELNYVYIGDFNLKMRVKLLLKIFEKAPIVDDSIHFHERLESIAEELVQLDEIGYWFGKRIDICLNGDYVLSTVFDEYTELNTIERLVEEVKNEKE